MINGIRKVKRSRCIVLLGLCLGCQLLLAQGLTLDSCLQLARQNNPELRKAELGVKRAEQVKMQAMTKYFPQVQGMGFGFHALHPLVEVNTQDIAVDLQIGNAAVRDLLTTLYGNYGAALDLDRSMNLFQHGYMVGVTALQPVFMGGKVIAGNQLAKVGVEAAQVQADMTQRDQLEQVEQLYWLVYGLQQKQAIIDDATHLLDTIYHAVEAAVGAGLALPSDLMQVLMKQDDIARRQIQLQSGQKLAQQALAIVIGLDTSEPILLAEQEPETEELLPMQTYVQPVEHQLLALQLRAAQLERQMALADVLPHLVVGANYSYSHWQADILKNGLGRPDGNGALFVMLNVPLTGWWETGHKLKEKQYAIEQARIDQQYLGKQLDLRTKQAYDQMIEAFALMQLQQHTLAHAQEAYEQTETNYHAGMATIMELLQAQTALTQAKADWTDSQIAYKVQTKRYKDLSGNSDIR